MGIALVFLLFKVSENRIFCKFMLKYSFQFNISVTLNILVFIFKLIIEILIKSEAIQMYNAIRTSIAED